MAVTPNEDAVKAGYEISCKRTSMTGRPITRLEDLARLAGVSIATVSRALNDSAAVNVATKRENWKLEREDNYPFRCDRYSLVEGRSGSVRVGIGCILILKTNTKKTTTP